MSLIEKGGVFYLKNPETNEIDELPKLSEISGIVRGNRRNGFNIAFDMDSSTGYAKDLGDYMVQIGCKSKGQKPNTTYSNIVVFDDIKYKVPIWAFLTVNVADNLLVNSEELQELPEKDGTSIVLGKTRTASLGFGVMPALISQPVESSQKPPQTPTPEFKPVVLDLTSPFKFDSIEFNENSDSQAKLDAFIQEVKKYYSNQKLEPIEVLASASIDGNPNEKLKNGLLRKDYDLRLSQNRANHIAEILTNATGLKFVGRGIGQTDQFLPNVKWPNSNRDETAPNRRLIVNMPKINVQVR